MTGDSDNLHELAARINQGHAAAVDAFGGEQNLERGLGALDALLDRLMVEGDSVPDAVVERGRDGIPPLLEEIAGEFCVSANELRELLAAFLEIAARSP